MKAVGVTHSKKLNPKAHQLYKIASDLKKTIRRLHFENKENKERISEAKKFPQSHQYLRGKVNLTSLNFIISQIRLLLKKSKGRRFSIEDKIFALSLLKQSGRGYRLLLIFLQFT